ncbi:hypothetical protein WIS52_02480 [Pseudonocardia nematodicida]|uniref:AAA domain-containing protein n=1 Tax=Pseudonocardia nematodicida TaxID=1206997 RepID=A0ABV1K4E4_9PSEU
MIFLASGASGTGKSTVRELLAPRLGATFEAVELADLAPTDAVSMRWRQETAEIAAARAAELRPLGRHLLLSGDPVAPAELVAAPSAVRAGGIAACLLDADARAQTTRLTGRGEDPALLEAHLGFARWMREHAADPLPRLDVLTGDPAPGARWDRVARLVERDAWRVTVVDTSGRSPGEVADAVEGWITAAGVDERLVMHPSDEPGSTA